MDKPNKKSKKGTAVVNYGTEAGKLAASVAKGKMKKGGASKVKMKKGGMKKSC